MVVTRIKASNFKSFKDIDISLNKFNVLIGANASGKTNFIQIFKFLRDFKKHGLDNAVSLQGGVEYLRNINIGSSEDLEISIFVDCDEFNGHLIRDDDIVLAFIGYEYLLSIQFDKKGFKYKIKQEMLDFICEYRSVDRKGEELVDSGEIGKGHIVIIHEAGNIIVNSDRSDLIDINIDDYYPLKILNDIRESDTILEIIPVLCEPSNSFKDIFFYDIDPKLPKKAVSISGKIDLEEDGCNIALVMKHLFGDKEKKRKFSNLINDILPFVEDVGVEKFADQSLLFTLKENYFKKEFMPASLVSDGTINITALIVALYFSKSGFTVIEEPERNMHPKLMSKLMSFMKDASENKQILITTHNPELVKHADINDLLLVSRGKDGYSNVTRPSEIEHLKHFLENDIGLGEIHTDDLWGV
jgi:predicted ATPase